jgi:hypothetical protein
MFRTYSFLKQYLVLRKELGMKLRVAVITVICIGLFCGIQGISNQANAAAAPAQEKITVLNPMGTPPPIVLKPMAEPLSTLDGKTIYFVNTGYIGTDRLESVMMDWFKAHYPKANVVYKVSRGGMTGVDKALWAEIGEKADAVVIGLGH